MKANQFMSIGKYALLWLLTAGAAFPQDAAVANPVTVKVKLDNASVRVLETMLNPGQKEQIHFHPACVIYVISGGKFRSHASDGTFTDGELATGATIYREPVTHWTENIGANQIHLIITELKDRK